MYQNGKSLIEIFYGAAATQFPVARLLQAVMDSVPANADVHVEINQNPVGYEQIEVQQQQSASSTGATTTSTSSESGEWNKNHLIHIFISPDVCIVRAENRLYRILNEIMSIFNYRWKSIPSYDGHSSDNFNSNTFNSQTSSSCNDWHTSWSDS